MKYLEQWVESLVSTHSLGVSRPIRVEGVRVAHLGPKLEVARIEFLVENADAFCVVVAEPNIDPAAYAFRYIDYAVFGLLDVLLVAEDYPLRNIRVTVVSIGIDPVSSSMMAFRRAGRDAGRKVLQACRGP